MEYTIKELLTRDMESETIASEIYDRLIDAVKSRLIADQIVGLRLGPDSIPGDSIQVDLQSRDKIVVEKVGEGAEFPDKREEFASKTLTPSKYGLKLPITREMVEDSKFDMVEHQVAEAGYQMEKKLDSLLLSAINDGASSAGNQISSSGGLTLAKFSEAMSKLEENDYQPTDAIIDSNIANDLRQIDTFTEAEKVGVNDPTNRLIGRIFGVNLWRSNNGTTDYLYMVDSNQALALAEKRPISVDRYDEATKDLVGAAISARWDVDYLRDGACARIDCS